MADPSKPDARGLDDDAVERRLVRLNEILGQLERIPGRTAELALQAAETLIEVYGEALRRVTSRVADSPDVLRAFTDDELLRHLLVLHRVHPDPTEQRVAQALDNLRPQLRAQGAEVELTGIHTGVADVCLTAGSPGCSTNAVRELVREQVLAAAPELTEVNVVAGSAPRLIPVTALRQRPAAAATGGAG